MIKHKTTRKIFNIICKLAAIGFFIDFINLCRGYIPDKLTIGMSLLLGIYVFWFIKLNDPKEGESNANKL